MLNWTAIDQAQNGPAQAPVAPAPVAIPMSMWTSIGEMIGPGWPAAQAPYAPLPGAPAPSAPVAAPAAPRRSQAPWWAPYAMAGCGAWLLAVAVSMAGAVAVALATPAPVAPAVAAPAVAAETPGCNRREHVTRGMCGPCYRAR